MALTSAQKLHCRTIFAERLPMTASALKHERQKFKTILIQRSSRKMNKNKYLLILHYLWKIFNFATQQIISFLFMFHIFKLFVSKFRQ